MESEIKEVSATREERFVNSVIQRCQTDKGFAARLRRADNPATEYQSWDFLVSMGVDLDRDYKRLPFATIAAAIAKSKSTKNGKLRFGKAIAECYPEGGGDQAKGRLRRLLACDDLPELCRILRPLFSLIDRKVGQDLDFSRLLKQICLFSLDDVRQNIKAEWAQEFYRHQTEGNKTEEVV